MTKVIRTPDEMFKAINRFMDKCRQLLDQNIEPDMTGLDDQVKALTDDLQSMPLEQLAKYQPQLKEMSEGLDDLREKLEEKRDAIRGSMANLSKQQQASTAYQTTQSTSPTLEGGEH